MEAFFESSLVLYYALLPVAVLEPLLPPPLELDVFQGSVGLYNHCIVKTKDLRPKGFPAFMK